MTYMPPVIYIDQDDPRKVLVDEAVHYLRSIADRLAEADIPGPDGDNETFDKILSDIEFAMDIINKRLVDFEEYDMLSERGEPYCWYPSSEREAEIFGWKVVQDDNEREDVSPYDCY